MTFGHITIFLAVGLEMNAHSFRSSAHAPDGASNCKKKTVHIQGGINVCC